MCNRIQSAGEPDPRDKARGTDPIYQPPKKDFLSGYKMPEGETSIYPFKSLREYAINMQKSDPAKFNELIQNGTFKTELAPTEEPDPTMYQRQGNALNRSNILFNQNYQKDNADYWRLNSEADQLKASKMREAYSALAKAKKRI